MLVITYDYETYWRSKDYTLSKMSPIEYIRHPDFYAQMLGISVNGGPVTVVEHDDIPAALAALELHKPDRLVVGHNGAGFDHLITSEVYGIHPALPTDTIHMMRWTGVSRLVREQLASMTHWFGTGEKRAGTVISDGKRTKADFTPEAWEDFKRYCAEDVQQTAACAAQMLPHMTADALLFSCITSRMATEPVFYINPKPLAQFIADHDERTERTRRELQALFHFPNQAEFLKAIRSESTFCAMLEQLGSAAPLKVSVAKTATAKAKLEAALETETDPVERAKIEAKLSNPASYEVMTPALAKQDLAFMDMLDDPDDRVRQLVQARMEHNSSVPRTRAMNLLRMGAGDKAMPILLKCFYAHTSRYGAGATEGKSDGVQVQNIPKHRKDLRPLRQGIVAPAGYKVVACDSSQIEARVLAYIAGEYELLAQFREGRDPYAELAAKFGYGKNAKEVHDGAKAGDTLCKTLRQAAKRLILSCGYGTGAAKLADTLIRDRAMLSQDRAQHRQKARELHQLYRANNQNIVALWARMQKVIEHMVQGGEGWYGGPNNNLFHYGTMPVCGREAVPSIVLPSGFVLRYPNLRMEYNGGTYAEFYYDRPLGKNVVATKTYGGALTENCQSKGTLVLTDSGWKPIETIGLSDLIYDGVDFVSHQGLVCKGTQECVCVNGVYMTPDHKILMEEDHESRLRLATPLRPHAPQLQGFAGGDVWEVDGSTSCTNHRQDLDVGVPLRVRRCGLPFRQRRCSCCKERVCAAMSAVRKSCYIKALENARNDKYPALQCVALNDAAVFYTDVSNLSAVRRARYYSVRKMAYVRGILRGRTRYVSTRAGFGPYKQRWELLPRELPVDNVQRKQQKPCRCVYGSGCKGTGGGFWREREYNLGPYTQWVAAGAFNCSTGYSNETVCGSARVQKEVYDIINCGPRHRFVVRGTEGPFIVANCTQSLAFQILMYQAVRMSAAGIPLAVNIHDSFAAVVPEAEAESVAQRMIMFMSETPPWVEGLPLAAEAEIADDFTVV